MSQDPVVYDLGEVGLDDQLPLGNRPSTLPKLPAVARPPASAPRTAPGPPFPPVRDHRRHRDVLSEPGRRPAPALSGALSVIVPGSGQMLAGETASGLFVMSALGLAGALGWAALATFDRIGTTLAVFGISQRATIWMLAALYTAAALLHVGSVVHAQRLAGHAGAVGRSHPILAAIASTLLPGWGQALNGHRIKAAIFLTGTWTLAAAWLVSNGPVSGLLESQGLLPGGASLGIGWSRIIPVASAVWCLAVYDAAAAAVYSRRS